MRNSGFNDFVLLELEKRARRHVSLRLESLIFFPWGAHYIPAPMKENTALVSLLEEMGVVEGKDKDGEPVIGEQFLCRDPEERVFYKGRWYEGLYLHAGETEDDKQQLQKFNAEWTTGSRGAMRRGGERLRFRCRRVQTMLK